MPALRPRRGFTPWESKTRSGRRFRAWRSTRRTGRHASDSREVVELRLQQLCQALYAQTTRASRSRRSSKDRRHGSHRPRGPPSAADHRRAGLAARARRARPAARRGDLERAGGSPARRQAPTSTCGSTARSCATATRGGSPRTRAADRRRLLRADPPRQRADQRDRARLERDAVRYQGNWFPHQLRPASEDGIFFAGDSAGHCIPLSGEGIRTAFYFGIAAAREIERDARRQATDQPLAATAPSLAATHPPSHTRWRCSARSRGCRPTRSPVF